MPDQLNYLRYLNGPVNNATLPAFFAYLSAVAANVTGDNTVYTLVADTELFDQGLDYNNGTGIFVAPVAGEYFLSFCVLLQEMGAAHTTLSIKIVTTSNTYVVSNEGISSNPFTERSFGGSVLATMGAGDTASVTIQVGGGAKIVDIYGAVAKFSYFCGYLVC